MSSGIAPVVEFGGCTLDLRAERLRRDGEDVALTPKMFQALRLLLGRPGDLVTREEFLEALWPGTFVEEANLSTTIWMLRKALGPDGELIVTVPKRGYRFTGPVTPLSPVTSPLVTAMALPAPLPDASPDVPLPTSSGATEAWWSVRSNAIAQGLAATGFATVVFLATVVAWSHWRPAEVPPAAGGATISIDARAQERFMRGRELFARGIEATYPERTTLLRAAVEEYRAAGGFQPNWSRVYSSLAQAKHWMGESDPARLYAESRDDARRAIALDDRDAVAHGALAYVLAAYFGEAQAAEREFRRAIDLDSTTEYRHGYAMLLSALGRFDEAAAMFRIAQERDPLALGVAVNAARNELYAGHADEALAHYRTLAARYRPVRLTLARALLLSGHASEALPIFRELAGEGPSPSPAIRSGLLCTLARTGQTQDAAQAWRTLSALPRSEPAHEMFLAEAAICMRDYETALAALERAYDAHVVWLLQINVDPMFEPIRTTPRFRALRARMGLP